ncbi:protein Mis18-alpha isoform X2 [Xenopus laevis]|uniref:Protein Mis18-alpha n=1 Tax=Xenopus laevis TaxID=8355 RepID=A0A8J1MCA2_XENLA|nr:protein Mis18-alpha isoform X2 [Xenopus laevis]
MEMAADKNGSFMSANCTQGGDGHNNAGKCMNSEEDPPVVFLCSHCRRPIGDTYSWMGSDMGDQCILLKAVSEYVSVDQVQIVSKATSDYGCTFETVSCSGCSSVMGKIYRCTPKHLDFKRDLFSLNIDAVDSYILGSADKQAVLEIEEPVTLGVRAALEEEIEKDTQPRRYLAVWSECFAKERAFQP